MLLAIVVDLAVTHVRLDEIGFESSIHRVAEERRTFFRTFDRSYLIFDPRSLANTLKVHIRYSQTQLQRPSSSGSQFIDRFRAQMYAHVRAVLPTVEVFSLRALSLLATLPIVAVCSVVVGLDGWVRREVRKAGAGIESARIYHAAKRSIKPICMWVSLLYLTVPANVDVRWAYGILVVVIPVLVGITISRFKKYV